MFFSKVNNFHTQAPHVVRVRCGAVPISTICVSEMSSPSVANPLTDFDAFAASLEPILSHEYSVYISRLLRKGMYRKHVGVPMGHLTM